ncbi:MULTISPECIES: hypothetical protein [Myxococcus]|uniref:Lipoprotein n=1 Tax=Myxococcus xanthus TaxID=34 RepID=A0AAE6G4B9_MYXXA|nr:MULTISPECIES: hypothetical protein [Myxococcus]QDE70426.1 hypothetical protein BHS09_27595 [Myxococcus xanthus]QDE77706.1 hypothetical protein BHS08_27615 [Myxococcus xanthus]QDE85092.1 hypothetical protein BHS07_28160 [Myxococcus xanthus]QDE99248.1 hypothetical protein BHS05_27400 [Myxococcus xanthus]QDF06944.1 hypothetical protein BHS04_27705 [Myxococcus xanthus]
MRQGKWKPARAARWGGVFLGMLLSACGGAMEEVPEAVPEAVLDALARRAETSNASDESKPVWKKQPTGRPGEGVAFDGKQFLVVWQDEREGGVFGARVTPKGKVLDPGGFPINAGSGLDGGQPRVAWDGKFFLVTWVSASGLVAAHVERDGDVRRRFVVFGSDEVGGPPGIACAHKLCLLAFPFIGDVESIINAIRVTSDGDVSERTQLSVSESNMAIKPAVAWDGKQFLVVWSDQRGGVLTPDIFGNRVTKDGIRLDGAGGVPLVVREGAQTVPDVTWTGNHFFVVWQDDKNDTADVYGARFRKNLALDGPAAFGIATGEGEQTGPRVAPSGNKSLVVWDATRQGIHRVRGVRVGDNGSILGSKSGFTISTGDFQQEIAPAVAAGDHKFLVTYAGTTTGTDEFGPHEILATRVTHDDTVKDRPALRLTRPWGHKPPVAASRGPDAYLAVWSENLSGTPGMLAARVSLDGQLLDVPVVLPAGATSRAPVVVWDGAAWFVAWEEGAADATGFQGARVSGAGQALEVSRLSGSALLPLEMLAPSAER